VAWPGALAEVATSTPLWTLAHGPALLALTSNGDVTVTAAGTAGGFVASADARVACQDATPYCTS
jgi:hypothetical protein